MNGLESSSLRGGRLIVVCGTSGGVGTTTVAINLAAALSANGAETGRAICALVDGSLHFADQRVLLNIAADASGIVEVAEAADSMMLDALRLALVRHDPRLAVLPGPASPEGGERISGKRFGEILAALRALHLFTVVDVGRELTEPTVAAFDSADDIVLVTSCDLVALKNTRLMLDLLARLGQSAAKIRIVLNRVGAPGSFSLSEVAGAFDRPFDAQLPDDVSTVREALLYGRPFTLEHRDAPLARAIVNLAVRLAKTGGEQPGFPKD